MASQMKKEKGLSSLTIPQLKGFAKVKDIKIPSGIRKATTIQYIEGVLAEREMEKKESKERDMSNVIEDASVLTPIYVNLKEFENDSKDSKESKVSNPAWLQHFTKYGWTSVPIAGLDPVSVQGAFWDYLEAGSPHLKRNDEKTWLNDNLPVASYGIIRSEFGHEPFQWKVRELCHPYFASLWNDKNLLCSFDGGCFMKVQKNDAKDQKKDQEKDLEDQEKDLKDQEKDQEKDSKDQKKDQEKDSKNQEKDSKDQKKDQEKDSKDQKNASSFKNWLHSDCGRFNTNFCSVQGIVCLTESTFENGGLVLLETKGEGPNERKAFFESYLSRYPSQGIISFKVNKNDSQVKSRRLLKICAKAGELILFDSRIFHCNFEPTKGYRMALYVSMAPAKECDSKTKAKRLTLFQKARMTTHWCYGEWFKATPAKPHTYGNDKLIFKAKITPIDAKDMTTLQKEMVPVPVSLT